MPTFEHRHEVISALIGAGHPLTLPELTAATRLNEHDATAAVWSLVKSKHALHLQLLKRGAAALVSVFATPDTATARPGDRLLSGVYDGENSWESSIHEAAHAVVARSMGGYTVKLAAREQDGEITVALPERIKGKKPFGAIVAFHLAGAAAEQEMENSPTGAAASDDAASALAAACEGGIGPGNLSILREHTQRQVRRLWPQILAVAADLYTRRQVKGEEALKLVEQACENAVTIK